MDDAATAALLLAMDPSGLGGAVLRAAPGPARDAWLERLRDALPAGTPWRRLPLGITDDRLLGGLDLTATLAAGRPVAERGVLAEADGGVVLAAMAERVEAATAARIAAAMDAGVVDGQPARFALIALDEGIAREEQPPEALRARVAFLLDFSAQPTLSPAGGGGPGWGCEDGRPLDRHSISERRSHLATITTDDTLAGAFTAAAAALGIQDPRAVLFALRAARAAAALAGRDHVAQDDAELAARLVLAPRASSLPAEDQPEEQPEEPAPPPPEQADSAEADSERQPSPDALRDLLVAAARAALPAGLLEALQLRDAARKRAAQGRSGAQRKAAQRGRPIGTRPGRLRDGTRLALVETLRNAAPWQPLRRRERPLGPPIQVRGEDIRLRRFRHKAGTTAIFVVDASGSAALHRLGEAKGAVELLLADCYVRRDQVAVIAFRNTGAETLLPPTPSLVRAKRSLAGLPGGGPTPLGAGIEAAERLAADQAKRGRTPLIVLLTDGRANVARDGTQGRPAAEADALAAAAPVRAASIPTLLLDTAPRPHPFARRVAEAMGARYLPLPVADAARLSAAVAAARG